MKKYLMIVLILALLLTTGLAIAEAVDAVPDETTGETAYDWPQPATIAGASAATLLIVQFIKLPLDKVWRIPTRAVVYVIALLIMLGAKAFTSGLLIADIPLLAINSFVVALTAMGGYELTFSPK